MYLINKTFIFIILTALIISLPGSLHAQTGQRTGKPDSAKKCAICHYQWTYVFYSEKRAGELVPRPDSPEVATWQMCFSCHDGSVEDSRNTAFNGKGHKTGILPSNSVNISEDFPLDDKGRVQCFTCHTPHALSSTGSELETGVFLRVSNENSNMCKICHNSKTGGLKKGNHPVDIKSKKEPASILTHHGKFGTSLPRQIICETCHVAHGATNDELLVLNVNNPGSGPDLCETCHTKKPGLSKTSTLNKHSHPVGFIPENSVKTPRKWRSGSDVVLGPRGELVCQTCHKPHEAPGRRKLLAAKNYKDSMCIQCHSDKKTIAGSKHDMRNVFPNRKNILGHRLSRTGPCSSCHLVHFGTGKLMWAQNRNVRGKPGMYCIGCHKKTGDAHKIIPEDYSHPMDASVSSMNFSEAIIKIRCSTCHDLHTPQPLLTGKKGNRRKQASFLRFPDKGPGGTCIECHPGYALIKGTDHDLRITAPGFKNIAGQTPSEGGVCSPCHLPHGAMMKKYLWATPPGNPWIGKEDNNTGAGNNVMIKLCTGCHSEKGIAKKHVPRFGLHPQDQFLQGMPQEDIEIFKDDFPVFTDSGETAETGNIVCSTCHNPHKWNYRYYRKGPGKNIEGTLKNSFLRADIPNRFCTKCHGKDGLIKFTYYHKAQSRTNTVKHTGKSVPLNFYGENIAEPFKQHEVNC